MLEQAFFRLVDNSENLLIFDERCFIYFCDDRNNIVNHNDAKISVVSY